MAEKTKVNVGKGFKRIYFVLCAILAWFLLKDIMGHVQCLNGELPDLCWMMYGQGGLSGTIVTRLIMFLLTIPIYFINRWVYLGFKKK